MNKNKAILVATSLFISYPSVDKFHITSDGQAFIGEHEAESHAGFLDKKNPVVFEVNRDDKATSEKAAKDEVSAEQAAVDKYTGMVIGLEKALGKAAAAKKPAIQKTLDEATGLLAEAVAALEKSNEPDQV